MASVYEVTADHDIVAIEKFENTNEMNDRIKRILTDDEVRESNTSVGLNAVVENQQFELDMDEEY